MVGASGTLGRHDRRQHPRQRHHQLERGAGTRRADQVSDTGPAVAFDHVPQIQTFFDRQYAAHERYWWRGENRYSIDPAVHTEFHATLLAIAARRGAGVA